MQADVDGRLFSCTSPAEMGATGAHAVVECDADVAHADVLHAGVLSTVPALIVRNIFGMTVERSELPTSFLGCRNTFPPAGPAVSVFCIPGTQLVCIAYVCSEDLRHACSVIVEEVDYNGESRNEGRGCASLDCVGDREFARVEQSVVGILEKLGCESLFYGWPAITAQRVVSVL